jgi:anti-sigma factor ChrR (cupin superfamily)
MSILVGYTEDAFADDREDVKFGFDGDVSIPEVFDADSSGNRNEVVFQPYEDKVIKGAFSYRKAMSICPLLDENAYGLMPKKVDSLQDHSAFMALVKFDAGASVDAAGHPGFLVTLVMQGDYIENGVSYGPGQLLIRAPSDADKVERASENGCTLLVSRYRAVEGEAQVDKLLKFDFNGDVSVPDGLEFTPYDGKDLSDDAFRPYRSNGGTIKGISAHVLFDDASEAESGANKGADMAFLKYEGNNQAAAKLHHHQGFETVLVMQGDYIENGVTFAPGHLVVRAPGTHHEMTSVNGCVILASRRKPVQGCIGRAKEMSDAEEARLLAAANG